MTEILPRFSHHQTHEEIAFSMTQEDHRKMEGHVHPGELAATNTTIC